jgi:ribosomal protein S18 acetylase RimI-like enzyme
VEIAAPALRPATEADRELLLEIYAGTRADELAVVQWDGATKRAFVEQQFHAQDVHYRRHYPEATRDVIEVQGEPAGRLYVQRGPDEILIVDIALLPAFRGLGVGTLLVRGLMEEAAAAAARLAIHVERQNPARRLYERLGFEIAGDDGGVYLLMAWTPPGRASR